MEVAIQVKDQIPDAVRLRVGPPPDVLNRETLNGLLDAWEVAVREELAGLIDER